MEHHQEKRFLIHPRPALPVLGALDKDCVLPFASPLQAKPIPNPCFLLRRQSIQSSSFLRWTDFMAKCMRVTSVSSRCPSPVDQVTPHAPKSRTGAMWDLHCVHEVFLGMDFAVSHFFFCQQTLHETGMHACTLSAPKWAPKTFVDNTKSGLVGPPLDPHLLRSLRGQHPDLLVPDGQTFDLQGRNGLRRSVLKIGYDGSHEGNDINSSESGFLFPPPTLPRGAPWCGA